jgi:hypothetical protein
MPNFPPSDELVTILNRIDELSPQWDRNGIVILSNGAQVRIEHVIVSPGYCHRRIIVTLNGQEVINYRATNTLGDYDYCDAWFKQGTAPAIERERLEAERIKQQAKEKFWSD